jgi:hypothetical protein
LNICSTVISEFCFDFERDFNFIERFLKSFFYESVRWFRSGPILKVISKFVTVDRNNSQFQPKKLSSDSKIILFKEFILFAQNFQLAVRKNCQFRNEFVDLVRDREREGYVELWSESEEI